MHSNVRAETWECIFNDRNILHAVVARASVFLGWQQRLRPPGLFAFSSNFSKYQFFCATPAGCFRTFSNLYQPWKIPKGWRSSFARETICPLNKLENCCEHLATILPQSIRPCTRFSNGLAQSKRSRPGSKAVTAVAAAASDWLCRPKSCMQTLIKIAPTISIIIVRDA